MFYCAIGWGHRPEADGDPCAGIVRYRRLTRGRLLGTDDLARVGAVLRQREDEKPLCVAAMRPLLLTGCRPGELRCLRWSEVKPDNLTLIDAKTGPTHVLLESAAQELLTGIDEGASGEWVFPASRRDGPYTSNELHHCWTTKHNSVWALADARLHDLRDWHVSHAVMSGKSRRVAGRPLGPPSPSTTNGYVHLADVTLSQAAQRVAVAIVRKFHRRANHLPESFNSYIQ